MKRHFRERLPLYLFLFAVMFLTFGYGLVAGMIGLPPAPAAWRMHDQVRDFAQYWKNDLGLEASRHLVAGYPDRRERFKVYRPDEMGDGDILIAGLTTKREALNSAVLFDVHGGEHHVWPFDYTLYDPDGPKPQNVFLHGLAVLPDGAAIANFDAGHRLARIDACGDVMWTVEGDFHHVVSPVGDGTLWTMEADRLVHMDMATGKILQRISIIHDLFPLHHAILGIRTEENERDELQFSPDAFHENHVEALTPELAPAFPMFKVGDLLVSMRSLNLVTVIDPRTLEMKWWKIGPWHRQHNPHFEPDGNIIVYNNNMNFHKSQILAVNPATDEVTVLFEGRKDAPFYSWRRGKVQELSDGRLLITETEKGRVFMVNKKGDLIFEYNNVYDDKRNGVLGKATYLPKGYFNKGALDCPKPGAAG
jgi:hypothetical protein